MGRKPSFDEVGEANPDKPSLAEQTRTTNEAGGEAFEAASAEFGLYKVVINNLLEDSYYDTADESFDKVWAAFDRVADENPEFVLQLAAYARQEEGFRDIAQLLLVMAANDERITQPEDEESSLIRDYTPAIIDRTDEFNSVLSYQLRGFGKPVPKGLRKGIEDALHKKYAVVKVEYSGTHETERMTYIESDSPDETHVRRDRLQYMATESVLARNGMSLDDAETAEALAEATAEIVDEGYVHDEYTFSKYSARNKQVSLHDVLNLVRPNPRSDNRDELFGRIAQGELDDNDIEPLREDRTWEATMSDDEDDRSEAEKWRDRLDDMGIMARVRNLRNMREAGIPGSDIFGYDDAQVFGPKSTEIVQNSQIFPFRYYQAFKACGSVGIDHYGSTFDIGRGELLDDFSKQWLNGAITVSTQNLPDTLESTFTAVDLSGSMDATVSDDSEMARAEIGTLFGAMLMQRNSDVGAFGSDFTEITASKQSRQTTPVLEMASRIYEASESVGNNTNGFKAIDWAREHSYTYDRFVVFTDTQLWDSTTRGLFGSNSSRTLKDAWDDYVSEVNPDAHLYVIDLASYGDLSMPEGYHNVHQVSGWSSNIVDFIDKNEQADDVVREIEDVSPTDY